MRLDIIYTDRLAHTLPLLMVSSSWSHWLWCAWHLSWYVDACLRTSSLDWFANSFNYSVNGWTLNGNGVSDPLTWDYHSILSVDCYTLTLFLGACKRVAHRLGIGYSLKHGKIVSNQYRIHHSLIGEYIPIWPLVGNVNS